jgi:hypothetical protein
VSNGVSERDFGTNINQGFAGSEVTASKDQTVAALMAAPLVVLAARALRLLLAMAEPHKSSCQIQMIG